MGISKDRLAALTDGIIAIAATIMVLELVTPEDVSLRGLLSQWPVFIAYLNSFVMIYLVWLNHHNAFKKIEEVSIGIFFWNGIWLFILTLVPFATRWVGEHPNETLPEFLYILILLLWSLMFQFMDNQIMKDYPDVQADVTNSKVIRIPLYGGFILALVLSFVRPILCLILVLIVVIVLTFQVFYLIRKKKSNDENPA